VIADEDLEQVRRARSGDYAAFEALVTKYESRVFALAMRLTRRREDAEDAVQETFLSVLEHLGEFREEAPFAGWLLRIATNHALKALRKRRGLPTVALEESWGDLPLPEVIAPWEREPSAADPEVRKLLDAALDELDEKYRSVFVLRDVEGLSTAEAARLLGITENNAKVRLLRARLQLRERLTKALGDPARRMGRPDEHGGRP
jgi:RNA polymerase sigma-70 factor (ECF subfamily)